MEKTKATAASIDQYISEAPQEVQEKLKHLRAVIKSEVPDAEERMAYAMPTFSQEGNLVHFAYFKNHIGFFPAPSGIENFQEELAKYKTSKGTVQFPLDEEIPMDLVREIVRFRLKENLAKAAAKRKK
ncbi:MAG: hypothetical protein CVU42_08455 [Chloroflexi bacterium HGW-Chloroflexi-4]|jgi:uncharacterized protein YdhG (YjbR/CyaY superfamily)|nr:MAG: hypothetical protein CVU42_08455 [Chloroflexi bacterium HGW-Chloroflexi-4]